MAAKQRRIALAAGIAALASIAGPAAAQELRAPAEGLVISWKSPPVPQMPTVTWTVSAVEGNTATVRTEARAFMDRMTTEGTIYRVIFPVRNVDPFGTLSEFEYDRASLDAIGRLEDGKTVRITAKSVTTITHPRTKQETRQAMTGVFILTVERHEVLTVPAGTFDTVVLRVEAEGLPGYPAIPQVVRRYWYAPEIGWYVRHEIIATSPTFTQRNEYVAAKITQPDSRAERR